MRKVKIVFTGLVLALFFSILKAEDSVATMALDNECGAVTIIFARGSGAKVEDNNEAKRFEGQISRRLQGTSMSFYELGTEAYAGYQYPAVNVGNVWNGNAIGAKVSAGYANDYGDSVDQGARELLSFLLQRHKKCPNEYYALGGYSQGAQVVGQALQVVSGTLQDRIIFSSLFGDPKLHLPEGWGILPSACLGRGLSPYRRDIANCRVDSGSLGARKPYLTEVFAYKSGLWCVEHDFVCGSSKFVWDTSGHGTYAADSGSIDAAAREVAIRLRAALGESGAAIDVTHHTNTSGATGLDVLFVLDTTGSMSGVIGQTKQFIYDSTMRIKALNGRVGMVLYKDQGDNYTAQLVADLQDNPEAMLAVLSETYASGGGDTPEAALHALMTGFNGVSWRNGATKAAILLTDAGYHNPDYVDGTTLDAVVRRSLEIDPVNVYPVVSSWVAGEYQTLAERTSGQVITHSGDAVNALEAALTKIENRPMVRLKMGHYFGPVGSTVRFDASDSYVVDSEITMYKWDFDGLFDSQTTTPVAEHAYTSLFDGHMQVRAEAANGTIASASAVVQIGTYVQPQEPGAPQQVRVTGGKVKKGVSSAVLTWQGGAVGVEKWEVRVGGIPLGLVGVSQTSVEITDIERVRTVEFSVRGVSVDGMVGPAVVVELPPEDGGKHPCKTPLLHWKEYGLEAFWQWHANKRDCNNGKNSKG